MLIGIAALFLAVGAYVFKEGIDARELLARISRAFGFVVGSSAPRITDGSLTTGGTSNATTSTTPAGKDVVELDGLDGEGRGYKSSIPSRNTKEEVLIVDVTDTGTTDEEDGEKTPTKASPGSVAVAVPPVAISLSAPEIDIKLNGDVNDKDKSVGRRKPTRSRDDDDDYVPMFPALNSAQRASKPSVPPPSLSVSNGSMAPPPLPVPSMSMGSPSLPVPKPGSMPPPSLPIPNRRPPTLNAAANARNATYSSPSSSLSVPPGPSSLAVPRSTGSSLAPPPSFGSLAVPPTHSAPPPKPRQKVLLTPGHSPLDWAAHQRTLPSLPLRRITPTELALHGPRKNESKQYWTVLDGRVYDVTPYLPYHPGGDKEVLRVCGKDGTSLFNKTHSWVSFENMLRGCEVGILVSENELPKAGGSNSNTGAGGEEDLEAMD